MFDSPVVSIHIPQALRGFAGGHHEITASGDTVGDVIDALGHEYPAIRSYLISTSGQLQPGVAVFLGPRSVRELQGLATPIDQEEVVSIVPIGAL
ncbi:MAG TPA: MoaD/ThiS family protein [Azonexus sp.]|jgi:molybdopterin converting factor small subunit|nr:MoaD/ThiS family protein [Azonexus sp.]